LHYNDCQGDTEGCPGFLVVPEDHKIADRTNDYGGQRQAVNPRLIFVTQIYQRSEKRQGDQRSHRHEILQQNVPGISERDPLSTGSHPKIVPHGPDISMQINQHATKYKRETHRVSHPCTLVTLAAHE
jgi:hypothetical protein